MASVVPPAFTDTVNQQFFIEAQGGSKHPISYLDRFPDDVYSKAIDSTLVTFLYALLGPVGAGLLRQEYLEARLRLEEAGLNTANLDSLYTSPFAFARLAEETYELDASASLLSAGDRATILANDAQFRNRAIDFLKGIRAGGTLKGISMVAKSGLNRPVDIVENYRALYDRFSDLPMGLPFLGSTSNLNEIIVMPRQDMPRSAQQSVVFDGEPTSGWFTLTLPLGISYRAIQVGMTNGSNIVTVPNAAQVPSGVYVSITSVPSSSPSIISATPTIYAEAGLTQSPTQIALVYPPTSSSAGQAYNMSTTGTFWAYVGNAETIPLPYNASALDVQTALQALPIVGGDNLSVAGGPLPDHPVVISFKHHLADRPIPVVAANLASETPPINGIGGPSAIAPLVSQMTDALNSPLGITATTTTNVIGVSADTQTSSISPRDEHAMEVALDQIRPITSFVTTTLAQGITQRMPVNTLFTGANYTEVVRYNTGNSSVTWPTNDALHWIESQIEHEAPRPANSLKHHYQGFHNVAAIHAYTEAALTDLDYESGTGTPPWVTYWDTLIGTFSPSQTALYPFLGDFTNLDAQYAPEQAVAPSPDPLVITRTIQGTGIINESYPVDYLGLSGIQQLPTGPTFWASLERSQLVPTVPCVDYLEIDLGSVQAVNYIYFEATRKPYHISVAYDVLDQSPARHFVPVVVMPPEIASSITSLAYEAAATNPWSVVEIHCTNPLSQMIYTRFIRLGFERTPLGSPFSPILKTPVPYSIEVRNLRIGRNVLSPLDRQLTTVSETVVVGGLFPSDLLHPGTATVPGSYTITSY